MRLTDECRSRLLSEFKDASNLDELREANKGKKLKDVTQVEPDAVEGSIGGAEKQLPISIDEYLYFNLVGNRLPFGLEKGFLITATQEDKATDSWSGKVAHLAGQIFYWRRELPDMTTVSFGIKDWKTWETDIRGLVGVKRKGDLIEFPTTHLWVDFDKYELIWFYHKRAIARKVIAIPFFLKKPLNWAIQYGLNKSIKGEAWEEGDESGGKG